MANLSSNPFNVAYLPYMGQSSPNPRNTFYRRRAPTNSDRRLYTIGDRWINTASQIAYILVGKTATTATWVQISGAGGVTALNGLTGALTLINQGGVGAVTWTVPGSGGPNTIGLSVNVDGVTMQIIGNQLVSTAAANFAIDAATAPGTNPAVSLAGTITINGAQVPAGTFTSGIRTHAVAANQFNIEAQRSSAQAVSTIGANGISHFNSGQFSVDGNGFVSLIGGGTAVDSFGLQAGVSPVTPTAGGLVTFTAASVAAAGIPVQTVGTGANSMEVQIQYASQQAASAAINAGLASFDSSMFTVDANGFVQLAGGSIAADSFTVNAFTAPGTNPVLPAGTGNVTVLGNQVAASGFPVRTNSLAANSYEIQVQRSSAQAVTTLSANGICHFDSSMFTVDGNGFVQLAGGSIGLDSIQVDAVTAPGVNPVVPDGAGLMTVGGTFVPAFGTPVRTHSSAINAYDIEVQLASEQAASASANAGLASFNNLHFDVDANGWVSNLNGVPISAIDVQNAVGPGVDPVLPSAAGVVQVNGTIVAAQNIPIRTNSLALNAYNIETQYSSAQAVDTPTSSGMCHFDSAQFTVSATGFVQSLASVAFVWQDSGPVAMANYNGYFATGAGAYTLPAGVLDGDTVEIIDNVGGGVVVTAQGGNTIRIQNVNSSANGTATSSQFGDALRLIFRASIGEWQCCPGGGGNWLLA